MKTYDYYLLDWDGNLAKTLHIWLAATRAVLEKHGIHKTDTEIGASIGKISAHFQEWGIADGKAGYLEVDAIAKRQLTEVELYPDALFVLEKLKDAGKHIALITSSPHENITHLLDKYNVRHFFEVIVAGDDIDVAHHKPHPESLNKALEQLGGSKDRAVMIGDSDKDIGAAINCGVDSILFFPEEHHKFYDFKALQNHKPTFIVEDFKQIVENI